VICSAGIEENPLIDEIIEPLNAATLEELRRSTLYVAPTFESFIYRFWHDNLLWFQEYFKKQKN
jgi:hypothetical protein